MAEQCKGRLFNGCPKSGVIVRDGKWYCKRHDPVAIRNRAAKRKKAENLKRHAHEMLALLEAAPSWSSGMSKVGAWMTEVRALIRKIREE